MSAMRGRLKMEDRRWIFGGVALLLLSVCSCNAGQPIITSLTVASGHGQVPVKDGMRLELGARYFFRANVNASTHSVRFQLDSQTPRIENFDPFISAPFLFALGKHTIRATPFTHFNSRGTPGLTFSASFIVASPTPTPTPKPSPTPTPKPSPTPTPTPSPTPTATPALANATISWSASDGATGYIVVWGVSSLNYTMKFDCGNELTARLVSKFTPGTTYYFAVEAYNAQLCNGQQCTSGPSNEAIYTP
jgi:hypothetical protein